MLTSLLLAGLFAVPCRAAAPASAAPSARFAALGLPAAVSKARLEALLQSFVDAAYGRGFRHLGDERDFDHGHLLLNAKTLAPVAILYHTQELAHAAKTPDFGYLDASARNWIQWLDGRGIENADRYVRTEYPRTAAWNWFVAADLPKLRARRTITDKMLDPDRLGAELAPASLQWTFTRTDCGPARTDADSNVIGVVLPDRTPVCLSLSSS
jgi:hypothetical protein